MKYQTNYSQHFPATLNLEVRQQKAQKITRLLLDFMHRENFNGLKCLDLGCSIGAVSYQISKQGGSTVGVDIDWHALQMSIASPDQALFVLYDGEKLPFSNQTFDLIICSQVYEHVPDLSLLVAEIQRLLKKDGVCFFSGPNRWAFMEEHYHLPLLSWFPKELADRYVRLFRRSDEYFEKPRSAGALRKALAPLCIHDLTQDILINPDRYKMGTSARRLKLFFRRIPAWAFYMIGEIVPNFNWILTWH